MSVRLRAVRAILAAVVILGLAGMAGMLLHDLGRIAAVLADPQPLVEQVVDEFLAANPSEPRLRADDPLLRNRTILVTSNINEITAKDVVARLMFLDDVDPRAPIDLYLSTQGGWVDSAFTIIDAMSLIKAPVNTWAIGGCYSAGALILAAGTGRRYASPNAMLMIHASLDEDRGCEHQYTYEHLALDRYERVWRERAALPDAWFPMVGGEEYYLSAEEALRFKIVDEIAAASDVPRQR